MANHLDTFDTCRNFAHGNNPLWRPGTKDTLTIARSFIVPGRAQADKQSGIREKS